MPWPSAPATAIALDELNRNLAEHDLMFGPRPATHRSCTIGGMIGNNFCGSTEALGGRQDVIDLRS